MPRQTTLFDAHKLSGLSAAVYEVMRDSQWWTLAELEAAIRATGTYATGTGISARVRELRKFGFGVDSRPRVGKIWEYRLT